MQALNTTNQPLGANLPPTAHAAGEAERQFSMNNMNPQPDTILARPGRASDAGNTHIEDGRALLLPGAHKHINSPSRQHIIAFLGEFVGTFLFLFFAFAGAHVANSEDPPTGHRVSTLLYIALAFGFSLAVNAWVFFRISGGLFNPAVTIGLMLIGSLTYVRAAIVFIAQILGAMAAAALVAGLLPGPVKVSTNLSPDTSVARGLFIEVILTAELVFAIFMLAAEKHRATFLAPIGIGLALFIAVMSGAPYTGASLNPARSFGPCIAERHFPGYHWIYWVGPILGALLAVLFYRFVKALEYEVYGAYGQDADRLDLGSTSDSTAYIPESQAYHD